MELQGRNLSLNMVGDDVALLHRELGQLIEAGKLDARIEQTEIARKTFGPTTERTVILFQRKHVLRATAEVDERTAMAINAAVDALGPERFTVSGHIRQPDGSPFARVRVAAIDKDLRHEQPLGEATTDERGHYMILYASDQFRRAEKRSADLVVRVLSAEGLELGASDILFNAPLRVTIDMAVAPPQEPRLSEYERLLAALSPVLEGLRPAELTEEDVSFLLKELAEEPIVDESRLNILAKGAQLSQETNLPNEFFYGIARQLSPQLPLKLKAFLALETSAVRQALEQAITGAIIPAGLRDRIDTLIERFEQLKLEHGVLVQRELVGQLMDEDTNEPLKGFRVRAFDLEAGEEPNDLGYDTTDSLGRFAVAYITPRRILSEDEAGDDEVSDRRLRLHILNPQGEEIHQVEIRIQPEQLELEVIRVSVPKLPEPADIPATELASTLDFNIPDELATHLAERGIQTLADIRRAGGIAHLEDLPVSPDHPSAQMLDAHANLILVSDDTTKNHALVERGFSSITAIARKTRADFVKETTDALGDFTAAEIHAKASAQTHVLNNILTGLRVDAANVFRKAGPPPDGGFQVPPGWQPIKCSCKDCEAAVSPLAYLADLLDYALKHLKNDGNKITLSWLARNFHQPFGDLPASCEEMDRKVRQVRIFIEVLRSYLDSQNLPKPGSPSEQTLNNEEKGYRLKAYTTLLAKIGTSYEKIRLAQNDPEDEREKLASRLGIDLDPNHPDTFAELFLDPAADPEVLTEAALEMLFGLVDTTRDSLSEGAKFGDDQEQITRWNLDDVEWVKNTDPDGFIHLRIKKEAANNFKVELFKDKNLTKLVAEGKRSSAIGSLDLAAKDNSGLSGIVDISYKADSEDIRISSIPMFLSWRLEHLRTLWRQQDWPTDPYTIGAKNQLPIIDPDVIGPDDLRNPTAGHSPFDLWLPRRNWVDGQLAQLKADHEANDLEYILKQVIGDPLPDLATLQNNLLNGIDLENTKKTITEDLHFIVESFQRLMEIRTKNQTTANQPEAEQVADEEWCELYSILIQARKQELSPDWIQEEEQAGIFLNAKQFWISEGEPTEGNWPPLPENVQPLIDPENLKLDDLPEPTIGKDAIEFWKARREKLDQIYENLKAENEANGFDSMLKLSIGDQETGDDVPHNLDELKKELDSGDPNVADAAKQKVEKDFYMTVDDFLRLMEIKVKADQSDTNIKPTVEEWAEVYAILTTAQKVKREFPAWIIEESQAGMDVAYWKALKARLPRWRATAEIRQAWQRALRIRSRAPLIDPDLIGPVDLKKPVSGDAFSLWQDRSQWVDDQLDALKQSSKDQAGFNTIVESALGVTATDLTNLSEVEKEGNDITARLEQLSLPRNAFSYLLRINDLLENISPVLDSEWNDVYSILVQMRKRREFAEWRNEERTQNLILGPDDFKIPGPPAPPQFPPPEPEPLPAWRATWRDRRDWQDALQSRMDQERSTIEGLQEAGSETEDETLLVLRDGLIAAINEGNTFAEKTKWVTDYLLIDAKVGGCQITTRVAQAIETIQGLLWSVRTGQLKDTYPKLSLHADDFDEEWKWIGSYATWRSAMFVFMYPENILMPSFRKRQTPVFRRLANDLRKNRRLTPADACKAAKTYSDYFRDVCTLTVEATCRAKTRLYDGEGCKHIATGCGNLFYMFGRGGETNTVYWSAYDPNDESGYAQTFWDPVQGLNNVTSIIGAGPYKIKEDERYIYLFALTNDEGKQKLVYIRYNLERGIWDQELVELELHPDEKVDTAVLVAWSENVRPRLFICTNKDLYLRTLAEDGTELDTQPTNPLYDSDNPESDNEWEAYHYHYMQYWEVGVKQFHAVIPDSFYGHLCCFTGSDDNLYLGALALKLSLGNNPWLGWVRVAKKTFIIDQGNPYPVYMLSHALTVDWMGTMFPGLKSIVPQAGYLSSDEDTAYIVYHRTGTHAGVYRALAKSVDEPYKEKLDLTKHVRVAPCMTGPFDISPAMPDAKLWWRRALIRLAFSKNASGPESNLTYLREAYYFVPMLLALQLQKRGEYTAALDWYRTVYDYSAQPAFRKIYHGLKEEESYSPGYERIGQWLLEPLDPHSIAATRRNTYTRFTLLSLVRCFLEYADAEFTRDTAESVARARTLYLTALELLDDDALKQRYGSCEELIGLLDIEVGDPKWRPAFDYIKAELAKISETPKIESAIDELRVVLTVDEPWKARFSKALTIVDKAKATESKPPKFVNVLETKDQAIGDAYAALLTQDIIARAVAAGGRHAATDLQNSVSLVETGNETRELSDRNIPWLRTSRVSWCDRTSTTMERRSGYMPRENSHLATLRKLAKNAPIEAAKILTKFSGYYIQPPSYQFCIPPNPVIEAYRLHAELNLYKLRTCRNIAGMKRELETYAAPTDTISGLPMIGVGGQLVLPGIPTPPPTQYRYAVLIERAKQLVQLATQIEASMLSSLEKRDAEYYNRLKARQDVQLSRQGVRLQMLRLKETSDGVKLAELQRDQAIIQVATYQEWIEAGANEWETKLLDAYREAADCRITSAIADAAYASALAAATAGVTGAAAAITAGGAAVVRAEFARQAILAEADVQEYTFYASHERRMDEWELHKSLADQDVLIGNQQIKIAKDHVRVVGQERKIAEIQADHAKETLEFLTNKFTNVELYDWMSDILEGVYSTFLQQATAMAKLAENQLAFERQETPPAYIQADYWEAAAGMEIGGDPHSSAPDRRGLTGSARLLQDIYQLDQYAFETNKRKLQLTKTISLAQLAPVEFQRFRETGVLLFATPIELFDRDFPGHYLRLIKRVRTSVVALIPSTAGIHATLSTTGLSRVVIGSTGLYQNVQIKTLPESVALTSPVNATGLFELTPQPQEMLVPFEGMGVNAFWEFRMPKASNLFDYRTIADVLLTIEYTALDSFDYRQQVIQQIDTRISADRSFSFRYASADQWYDLHNPDHTTTPMTIKFQTRREDFPPNVEDLKIQHVVLYFARASEASFEVPVTLHFTEKGDGGSVGGSATTIDGVISTRRGNAGSWTTMIGKSPGGVWELALPNNAEMKNRFKNEEVEDILFVITYSGRTPEWPA